MLQSPLCPHSAAEASLDEQTELGQLKVDRMGLPPLLSSHPDPGRAQQSPCLPPPSSLFLLSSRNSPSVGEQGYQLSHCWEKLHSCPWPRMHLVGRVLACRASVACSRCSGGGPTGVALSPSFILLLLPCCLLTNSSRNTPPCFLATELEYLDQQIPTRACLGDF